MRFPGFVIGAAVGFLACLFPLRGLPAQEFDEHLTGPDDFACCATRDFWEEAACRLDADSTLSGGPFSVAENTPNGTVVGRMTGDDADPTDGGLSYSITGGNALYFSTRFF